MNSGFKGLFGKVQDLYGFNVKLVDNFDESGGQGHDQGQGQVEPKLTVALLGAPRSYTDDLIVSLGEPTSVAQNRPLFDGFDVQVDTVVSVNGTYIRIMNYVIPDVHYDHVFLTTTVDAGLTNSSIRSLQQFAKKFQDQDTIISLLMSRSQCLMMDEMQSITGQLGQHS